tara:strand:- start:373 stop:546 length:174 start_codon:yes stop_codon:yes gene_type:complete
MTYKLLNDTDSITGETKEADVIIRLLDNASIPKDEANIDYQEYLKWVEEGNTAEAAD